MSKIERLLVPGSTEMPDCSCGAEMRLAESSPQSPDAEVRRYVCPACAHEFILTVWVEAAATAAESKSI